MLCYQPVSLPPHSALGSPFPAPLPQHTRDHIPSLSFPIVRPRLLTPFSPIFRATSCRVVAIFTHCWHHFQIIVSEPFFCHGFMVLMPEQIRVVGGSAPPLVQYLGGRAGAVSGAGAGAGVDGMAMAVEESGADTSPGRVGGADAMQGIAGPTASDLARAPAPAEAPGGRLQEAWEPVGAVFDSLTGPAMPGA
jgi:hypothetical protein